MGVKGNGQNISNGSVRCRYHSSWKISTIFNAVDLVNLLELEKQQDKIGDLAWKFIQIDAVILDERLYTNTAYLRDIFLINNKLRM